MANEELKKLEETLNKILEKKREEGISWIYADEIIKEARAQFGYPADDYPKWKWQGTNHQLGFHIKDYEKIDLSDFNLKRSLNDSFVLSQHLRRLKIYEGHD